MIFSLLPGKSSAERGLHFQVYWKRFRDYFHLGEAQPQGFLPAEQEPWSYDGSGDPNWSGYAGYFRSPEEISRFVNRLKEA